jgi:DNA repair exonuclease SbcCD ATPase subunit
VAGEVDQPVPDEEPHPLVAVVQEVRDENQMLHQQLASKQQELDRVSSASANTEISHGLVAELRDKLKSAEESLIAHESLSEDWQKKWKAAEDKAESLGKQMVAEIEKIKAEFNQSSNVKTHSRLMLIAGALIALAGLGAYGIGHYTAAKDAQRQIDALTAENYGLKTQHASDIKTIKEANQNSDDLNKRLKETTGEGSSIQTQLVKTQQKLAASNQQLAAAYQRIHELEASIQSANREIHTGFVTWSGTVNGTRMVDIRDGKTKDKDGSTVTGALPKAPCTISTHDPVKLKTFPEQGNQWSRVVFEVSGHGPVQVHIKWASLQ